MLLIYEANIRIQLVRFVTTMSCRNLRVLAGSLTMQDTLLKKTFSKPIYGVKFDLLSYKNSSRRFSHQSHLSKLDGAASYTLQSRILNYFRTNTKFNSYQYSATRTIDKTGTAALASLQIAQLVVSPIISNSSKQNIGDNKIFPHLDSILTNLRNPALTSKQFLSLLPAVDDRCCSELKNMNVRDILITLDAWMYILPHKIVSLKFYSLALYKMQMWISSPDINLSTEEFVLIIFYAGLLKTSEKLNDFIKQSLNYIDQTSFDLQHISIEELCIVTNAVFKTSTKIKSTKFLRAINNAIEDNLGLLCDPALFITLVKALRHAQFYNYQLLEKIAANLLLNENIMKNWSFTTKAHLLALYAGALYSKFEIISLLVASGLKDLESANNSVSNKITSHLSVKPRAKDVSRFLWSISYLGFPIHEKQVEDCIVPILREMLKSGEYAVNSEEIVDSLLSLWTSGYKLNNLLTNALTERNVTTLRNKNKLRFNSRLALLLTCVNIEAKHLLTSEQIKWKNGISKLSEPKISRHLAKRASLKKVYVILSNLAETLGFSSVECSFIIPHLHIAGIKVETQSRVVCIELLDKSVCLHESNEPQGLMQLKLRLLRSLGYPVIVINATEVEAFEDTSDLYTFLEEEFKKISRKYQINEIMPQ